MKKLLLTCIFACFCAFVQADSPPILYSAGGGLFKTELDSLGVGSTKLTSQAYRAIELVDNTIYAVTTDAFGTLDSATGAFSSINANVGYTIIGLGWNPLNDTLYASTDNKKFGTIDLTTGEFTQIGEDLGTKVTIAVDNTGLCFAQEIGAIGMGDPARIGKIDLASGVFTDLARANITGSCNMSIERETNQIFINAISGVGLAILNKTTGARIAIGNCTERWQAFCFLPMAEESSIHTVAEESRLNLYPNPVKDYLFIKSKSPIEKVEEAISAPVIVESQEILPEQPKEELKEEPQKEVIEEVHEEPEPIYLGTTVQDEPEVPVFTMPAAVPIQRTPK